MDGGRVLRALLSFRLDRSRALVGIVDDEARVVGIITLENLAEYMMVHAARQGWRELTAKSSTVGRHHE